jgi:hypothetical protein
VVVLVGLIKVIQQVILEDQVVVEIQQVLDQVILLQLVHLKEIMEEQEVEVIHFMLVEVVVLVL